MDCGESVIHALDSTLEGFPGRESFPEGSRPRDEFGDGGGSSAAAHVDCVSCDDEGDVLGHALDEGQDSFIEPSRSSHDAAREVCFSLVEIEAFLKRYMEAVMLPEETRQKMTQLCITVDRYFSHCRNHTPVSTKLLSDHAWESAALRQSSASRNSCHALQHSPQKQPHMTQPHHLVPQDRQGRVRAGLTCRGLRI